MICPLLMQGVLANPTICNNDLHSPNEMQENAAWAESNLAQCRRKGCAMWLLREEFERDESGQAIRTGNDTSPYYKTKMVGECGLPVRSQSDE